MLQNLPHTRVSGMKYINKEMVFKETVSVANCFYNSSEDYVDAVGT